MSKIFGERLKNLRIELEMYQKELANKLKVTPATISYWENGIKEPDFDTLNKIADLFGVSTDYLTGREKDKEIKTTHFKQQEKQKRKIV